MNGVFLAQSWVDIAPPFNPPFWSLNYEVWYYVIFGLFVYKRNLWLIAVAAFVAGPKILLLLPVWLLGVALYRWMPVLNRHYAAKVFFYSAILGLLYFWFDVSFHIREWMKIQWPSAMGFTHGSGMFVGDFLFGLIVCANFIGAASLDMKLLSPIREPIKYLSSFTFSIYLFHTPLVILIWNGFGVHNVFAFYGLLFLMIFAFGQLTERQTKIYRALLQRWTPLRGDSLEAQKHRQASGVLLPLVGINDIAKPDKT